MQRGGYIGTVESPKAPDSQGLTQASVLSQGHNQSPEESGLREGSEPRSVSPWDGPGGAACEVDPGR